MSALLCAGNSDLTQCFQCLNLTQNDMVNFTSKVNVPGPIAPDNTMLDNSKLQQLTRSLVTYSKVPLLSDSPPHPLPV